jgi:rhodanese-related sulfurtransferase
MVVIGAVAAGTKAAARACRILKEAGFDKIVFMNGGTKAWPYKPPAS